MRAYVRRLFGALMLDPAAYEDVERDGRATLSAGLTVVLSSIATAVGSQGLHQSLADVWTFTLVTLGGWMAWALVTFHVGTRVLPGPGTRTDVGELLRTLGFAAVPGLLLAFGALPGLAMPLFVVVPLWMLAAMVVAVRQALDYSRTLQAVAVCALGWTLAVGMVFGFGLLMRTRVQ